MRFLSVGEEALPTAVAFATHLKRQRQRPEIESPAWEDAPYRTTLFCRKKDYTTLYEVQGVVQIHDLIQRLADYVGARRHNAEFYLVCSGNAPASANLTVELKRLGIGLIVMDEKKKFTISHAAKNPVYIVTPDPALKYAELTKEISAARNKFNDGQRKDGLRDMCELIERETGKALSRAAEKSIITIPTTAIAGMDFSDHINSLASNKILASGATPLIDTKFKDDLHSFRGARNLIDHPAKTKSDDLKRQKQMMERMLAGHRLAAELVSLRRRLR